MFEVATPTELDPELAHPRATRRNHLARETKGLLLHLSCVEQARTSLADVTSRRSAELPNPPGATVSFAGRVRSEITRLQPLWRVVFPRMLHASLLASVCRFRKLDRPLPPGYAVRVSLADDAPLVMRLTAVDSLGFGPWVVLAEAVADGEEGGSPQPDEDAETFGVRLVVALLGVPDGDAGANRGQAEHVHDVLGQADLLHDFDHGPRFSTAPPKPTGQSGRTLPRLHALNDEMERAPGTTSHGQG